MSLLDTGSVRGYRDERRRYRAVLCILGALLATGGPATDASEADKGRPPHSRVASLAFAGMALEVKKGRLVIGPVLPGSPAALAGALPGDAVLVLNGVSLIDLDPLSPEAVQDVVHKGGKEELRMIVGRGAGTLGLVLPLRESGAVPVPTAAAEPLAIGAEAPQFTAKDLEGQEVSLVSFRGRPLLIEFWAAWCPPCRDAVIPLLRVAGQYGDRLAILGVSLDSDPREFEAFVYNHHLPGHQVLDGGWYGPVARLYGIASTGIPYSVVIDGAGRVVSMGRSIQDQEDAIARLVSSPSE